MRISIAFIFIILSSCAFGQLAYLRKSPSQKIEQQIGVSKVIIEFSRPQMKGRQIFGALVPYGKMWRTGANENTKISFSDRVKIGETEVGKGTYALFTKPWENKWDIYLYKEWNNLDVPNPVDSSKLLYLVTVPVQKLNSTEETLVINFYDITENTSFLGIRWENTEVRIPIEFNSREVMESSMEKEFNQNALDYAIAASYYYERNIELEKAKRLQALSIELREEPSAWAYNSYGKILYKLGEKEKAIEAIKYSLELSKATQNETLTFENEELLKEWE